jgi:hypothetical protein
MANIKMADPNEWVLYDGDPLAYLQNSHSRRFGDVLQSATTSYSANRDEFNSLFFTRSS